MKVSASINFPISYVKKYQGVAFPVSMKVNLSVSGLVRFPISSNVELPVSGIIKLPASQDSTSANTEVVSGSVKLPISRFVDLPVTSKLEFIISGVVSLPSVELVSGHGSAKVAIPFVAKVPILSKSSKKDRPTYPLSHLFTSGHGVNAVIQGNPHELPAAIKIPTEANVSASPKK